MTRSTLTRRRWVRQLVLSAAAVRLAGIRAEGAAEGCTLSIGTYALPDLSVEEAVALVAEAGFDGIELSVQSGADGEASRMPSERRREIRALLNRKGLVLTSVMEHLYPSKKQEEHLEQVERLRNAAALACELSPDQPPIVQTVLGGGEWEDKRNLFLDRLGDWTAATQQSGVRLAIKPHRGGALSQPSEAVWLIQQLGETPWLRMVYDYSHYAFRGMTMEETVATAFPYTAHVVVKDVVEAGGKTQFLLPGESGTFDYPKLLRLFYSKGYRSDVCCEVSKQVWSKPDYAPIKALETCYRNMSKAFEEARVPRG